MPALMLWKNKQRDLRTPALVVFLIAVLLVATTPQQASAAILLVQTRTGIKTASAGTTFTVTMTTNTTTGNTVICGVANDSALVNQTTGLAATGMTFTKITDQVEGTGGTSGAVVAGSLWEAVNITGATAPVITVTFTAGLAGGAICREYSGLAAAPTDKHASANNGVVLSAAPNSGPTATLTGSNDLVVGYAATGDSGNTYTAGATFGNAFTLKVGTTLDMGMEDKILSGSTLAQTATFTITNLDNWSAAVETLQAAGAAPTPPTGNGTTVIVSGNQTTVNAAKIIIP